jgi:hypothetical protein
MMDEAQVRSITRKFLDEQHLLDFIKIFEKEHNIFRGSHDKIQLPAAINVPQQVINTISGKAKLEDLEDVSIPTKAVGDFIQYNETTEKWTRQAALAEGSIVIAIADGYFSEDNTNLTWDNTSKIFKVIGTTFLDGAVVINDSNADKDFRVEGSGASYTHLLFTDASANKVGVNEDVPKALFHIRHGTCADYAGVHPSTALLLEGTGYVALQLQGSSTAAANIVFADDKYNPPAGRIQYNFNSEEMNFAIGGNVLVYFTTTGARFVQNALELDSTGYAVFIADSHNDNAYIELQEDNVIKWTIGFNYSESLNFQISAGIPGTNVCLEIETTLINLYLDVGIWGSQDLRFYGADDHYVGFKVPAGLIGDQIWLLPKADGPANEVLGTDGSGSLIWRTHDELAGFISSEHLAALDEDDLISNSNTNVATQQSIKAYVDTVSQPVDAELTAIAGLTSAADRYIRFTGSGTADLRTYANVLADLSGQAGAAFAWNSQNLTGIGTIGCGTITVANGSSINLQEDITFLGATTENQIKFPNNLPDAFSFMEGANPYLTFKTTNAAEAVIFGKVFTGVSGSTIGTLTLADGSITDSGGAISFGDEDLSTTGIFRANKVRIGAAAVPTYYLEVDGGGSDDLVKLMSQRNVAGANTGVEIHHNRGVGNVTDGQQLNMLVSYQDSDTTASAIGVAIKGVCVDVTHVTRLSALTFWAASGGGIAERARLTGQYNFSLGITMFGTNAVKVFAQGTGTAPTTSPADCFQMYSADIQAGEAAPHFRTEHGDIIKLYQQAHIADADGQLADITTKFNTLLSYLENTGLLASA